MSHTEYTITEIAFNNYFNYFFIWLSIVGSSHRWVELVSTVGRGGGDSGETQSTVKVREGIFWISEYPSYARQREDSNATAYIWNWSPVDGKYVKLVSGGWKIIPYVALQHHQTQLTHTLINYFWFRLFTSEFPPSSGTIVTLVTNTFKNCHNACVLNKTERSMDYFRKAGGIQLQVPEADLVRSLV
jgi:hypothetical protein